MLEEYSKEVLRYLCEDYMEFQKKGGTLNFKNFFKKWTAIIGEDFRNIKETDFIYNKNNELVKICKVEFINNPTDCYWQANDGLKNYKEGQLYYSPEIINNLNQFIDRKHLNSL